MTGVAQRMISSTALGATPSRSSSQRRRWSGKSVSAFMPWLMALRVVSLPATTRSTKKEPNSSGVRLCPSTSAWEMVVVMSSRGWRSRSARRSWAYCAQLLGGGDQAAVISPPYSGSLAPSTTLVLSKISP